MPNPARKRATYQIDLPVFSGPLDLLLHLIEREELDVTAISLARVTEQYLEQVEALKKGKIENMIDFVVVGARLVLIKSRALLPRPPTITDGEEEEDPAELLLRQLRQYKRFKRAAAWLLARHEAGLRTYLRVAPPPKIERQPDLGDVTLSGLLSALRAALAEAQSREESVEVVQQRRITIEGQLRFVRERLRRHRRADFRELLSKRPNGEEVAITLLAVLELIKRHEVIAHQPQRFGPIELVAVLAANGDGERREAREPSLPPASR